MHSSQRPIHANVYRTDERGGFDDESERIFYERSRKRRTVYTGRTERYNFDDWYKGHYGPQGTARSTNQTFGGFREEDLWVRRRKVYVHEDLEKEQRPVTHKLFGFLSAIMLSFIITGQVMHYVEREKKSYDRMFEEYQKKRDSRTEK